MFCKILVHIVKLAFKIPKLCLCDVLLLPVLCIILFQVMYVVDLDSETVDPLSHLQYNKFSTLSLEVSKASPHSRLQIWIKPLLVAGLGGIR